MGELQENLERSLAASGAKVEGCEAKLRASLEEHVKQRKHSRDKMEGANEERVEQRMQGVNDSVTKMGDKVDTQLRGFEERLGEMEKSFTHKLAQQQEEHARELEARLREQQSALERSFQEKLEAHTAEVDEQSVNLREALKTGFTQMTTKFNTELEDLESQLDKLRGQLGTSHSSLNRALTEASSAIRDELSENCATIRAETTALVHKQSEKLASVRTLQQNFDEFVMRSEEKLEAIEPLRERQGQMGNFVVLN